MRGVLAECPNDKKHNKFVTVAHVTQDWVVDPAGNFLQELATLETTHGPNIDNNWTCHTCGADAIVTAASVPLRRI
ncbi:hypothetical protein [Paenibacillus periandrae]|uniref:hypothetical protein n=1 Tax=Paenibacillus periandrae TaxID=1761741 RepID=UPI001F089781|nr:hypothetical protein [Paenibacillus periandrae]